MKNINSEDILNRASCLERVNSTETYHKSYYFFIEYFAEKNELKEQDLVIGSNFVYGWMPTILNFKSIDFQLAVEIINKAKKSKPLSLDDIGKLKCLINNSLVGVSKLLHFINPDVYAIWDSRVCNFLTGNSYSQKVENIPRYLEYLDLCNRIAKDANFEDIHRNFIKKVGYKVSKLRTVEQIMFIDSGSPLLA